MTVDIQKGMVKTIHPYIVALCTGFLSPERRSYASADGVCDYRGPKPS